MYHTETYLVYYVDPIRKKQIKQTKQTKPNKTKKAKRGGGSDMQKKIKEIDEIECKRPLKPEDIKDIPENILVCYGLEPDCLLSHFNIDIKTDPGKVGYGANNSVWLWSACNMPVAIRISKKPLTRDDRQLYTRNYDASKIQITVDNTRMHLLENYISECRKLAELSTKGLTPKIYWYGIIRVKKFHDVDEVKIKDHFCMILEKGNSFEDILFDTSILIDEFKYCIQKIYTLTRKFVRTTKTINIDIKPDNLVFRHNASAPINSRYKFLMIDVDEDYLYTEEELKLPVEDYSIKTEDLPEDKKKERGEVQLTIASNIMNLYFLLHIYKFSFYDVTPGHDKYEHLSYVIEQIREILKMKISKEYNIAKYMYLILFTDAGNLPTGYPKLIYNVFNHYFRSLVDANDTNYNSSFIRDMLIDISKEK